MNSNDNKEPEFPKGFEHVEERLNETLHKVQQIDDQLKNTPKERGPRPEYNPPNFVGRIVPGSRDKTRIALEEKQHELKMETLSKTEADTRHAEGRDGRVVRDNVREALFPNPYRQLSPEDRLKDQNTPKDIEQSQDYMDAKLVERAVGRDARPQPEQQVPKSENKTEMSMSARFSISLNYTKAAQKTDRPVGRPRDRAIEPDRD